MPRLTPNERNLRRKLKRHLDAIGRVDAVVAGAVGNVGYPLPRVRPHGFETFLSIIVSQQISTGAARAIFGRVRTLMPAMDAPGLLACRVDDLRAAGLSARKVEYAAGLAEKVVSGDFDPAGLAAMKDEDAIEEIVALRGFGRWSAEIYLMFSLGRADVFPADDLALQIGLQKLYQLPGKPTPKEARELTAHWSPRRSAGSLFLWHYHAGAPA